MIFKIFFKNLCNPDLYSRLSNLLFIIWEENASKIFVYSQISVKASGTGYHDISLRCRK